MTVIHVTSWRIAPGRSAEVLDTVAAAREIHRRHGFGPSAWRTVVAGSDPATLWYLLMSSGPAEHFAQMAALDDDPEWQLLHATRIDRADAAAALVSSGLWQTAPDLPEVVIIPSQVAPRGQIVTGYAPMSPAQRALFVSMMPRLTELAERHGMTVGSAEAAVAGDRTGAVSVVVGAPSLPDLGASVAALGADADWQAYQRDLAASPDRPVLTTRTVRQEIL